RFELAPGTQHVQADQPDQAQADDDRQPRVDIGDTVDQFGAADQHHATGEEGARGKGEGAERDQQTEFLGAEVLGPVGAITHQCAGKHRCANVVGQRVGGKRAEGDEPPGNLFAQMGNGDAVVPGQSVISAGSGQSCEQPFAQRNGQQAVGQVIQRDVANFVIKQEAGQDHRTKAYEAPDNIAPL